VKRDLSAPQWRNAVTPVGAHALAEDHCAAVQYERVRGVAQQAARLARATALNRHERAHLLSAAWLSWLAPSVRADAIDLSGPRTLRRAGHEDLARVLAWAAGAAALAGRRGIGSVTDEFPVPAGEAARALILLDIALVTTDRSGAPAAPAAVLAGLAERPGDGDPALAAFVGLVSDLGEHPQARILIDALSPVAAGFAR
jgi:hypothetical protein